MLNSFKASSGTPTPTLIASICVTKRLRRAKRLRARDSAISVLFGRLFQAQSHTALLGLISFLLSELPVHLRNPLPHIGLVVTCRFTWFRHCRKQETAETPVSIETREFGAPVAPCSEESILEIHWIAFHQDDRPGVIFHQR